jgi:hypothetical protein
MMFFEVDVLGLITCMPQKIKKAYRMLNESLIIE